MPVSLQHVYLSIVGEFYLARSLLLRIFFTRENTCCTLRLL